MTDPVAVRKVMELYLDEFNSQTNKPMKLVMFMDAIGHAPNPFFSSYTDPFFFVY